MADWNPWHGCHKHSEGCRHCYVYRIDGKHGRDASLVTKTGEFNLPVRKNRAGGYKVPSGDTVWTCFSSDFFVEEADEWRKEAWAMMDARRDLSFFFITKRPERFFVSLPENWGEGYPNVTICCTVENQARAQERLPLFMSLPILHKQIVCEPLLERTDLSPFLGRWVEQVMVGGESGEEARPCDFSWILSLREQCREAGVSFTFRQTGANFIKDGRHYRIPRKEQFSQARKAGVSFRAAGR